MKKHVKITLLISLIVLLTVQSISISAQSSNENGWSEKTTLPYVRNVKTSVEVNEELYVIGGAAMAGDGTTNYSKRVDVYNPITDTWTVKANMPTPRTSMGSAELAGKIYVIGGALNNTDLDKVEEYNSETNTWRTRASMPTPRRRLEVIQLNGKIYAIGGQVKGGEDLNIVEEYNPDTDTWTSKASMNIGRSAFGATVANGKIYVFGGHVQGDNKKITVEEYNPETNEWTLKNDIPGRRFNHEVITLGNRIIEFAGLVEDDKGLRFAREVKEYNPETDSWSIINSLPEDIYDSSSAIINGTIYLVTGTNQSGRVYTYTPTDNVQTPTNLIATPESVQIKLKWDEVSGASSYTILRSTTSGVIETVLADNITNTTYIDSDVEPGVTYYYVVRAVMDDAVSEDSNIASARIEKSDNKALLVIKLVDENDKEYDLNMNEVESFIDWYYDRGEGQGPAYYKFDKNYNIGPYISRKDYIAYDKIICFEVNEYIVE